MPPRPASLISELRSLPRPVWILFGGTFLNRFGSFVVPFLVLYLTRRGFSTEKAGVALGAYGIGLFVSTFIGGQLADRLGRKQTIIISMVTSAMAMIALSQASAYLIIILLSVLAGATSELYRPASSALIADLVPPEHRVTAYAVYRLAINAGFAAGPATAGFLADKSWLLVFAGDAATSLLFAAVALAYLPTGGRTAAEESRWSDALRSARKNRGFVAFCVASIFATLTLFQFDSTLPLHVRDLGFRPSAFGLLMSVNGVVITLTELSLTRLTRHWRRNRAIAAGWLLIGTGFALTGVARTIPALVATVLIWTLGEMIASPISTAAVADIAPPHMRGRYMGMYGMTWSIALMLGPPLGTLAYAANPTVLWIGSAISSLIAAVIVLRWFHADGTESRADVVA